MTGDFGFPGTLLALTALPERLSNAQMTRRSCRAAVLNFLPSSSSAGCQRDAGLSRTAQAQHYRGSCLRLAASCFQRSSRIPVLEDQAT
jgi:hypothetical protein